RNAGRRSSAWNLENGVRAIYAKCKLLVQAKGLPASLEPEEHAAIVGGLVQAALHAETEVQVLAKHVHRAYNRLAQPAGAIALRIRVARHVERHGPGIVPEKLDLDARAELDHPVRRNVEVVGDIAGVARHGGEEPLAPQGHAAAARTAAHGDDLLARQEERRLHQ